MLKKILISIGLSVLLLSTGSGFVQAYQIDPSYKPTNEPFSLKNDIKSRGAAGATVLILQIIAGALLYFAMPVGVIMIISAGFQMVIGSDDQEKIEQSKKHLKWSILGLMAVILSYSLVKIIITFVMASASLTVTTPPPS